MNPHIAPVWQILDLNTRLYRNCMVGVDDAIAGLRPARGAGITNSIGFIALHLLDARHFILGIAGTPAVHPWSAMLQSARGEDDVSEPAPVAHLLAAWEEASVLLEASVASLTDTDLRKPSPQPFPVRDTTVLGALAFLAQHESYHVGQLALLRRYAGLDAMKYSSPG